MSTPEGGDPESMVVEEDQPEPAVSLPPLSLHILQLIKTAQNQNGLKHGDYMRYRRHSASALQSLYKTLKMQHGRTKYVKRKLESQNITDVRHLHVPLLSAERCWAHAMELKKAIEAGSSKGGAGSTDALRKRRHAVKRLAKASRWAAELTRFAADRCDTRTSLEAEGYAAWMSGSYLLEREADWNTALGKFLRAKKVFGELAKVSSLDEQNLCLAFVEEMEPAIRYCNYQISKAGGAVPDASQLLALSSEGAGGAGLDLLQSKLAALQQGAQAAQAAAISVLEWQGRRHPVRHERVRVCLHQANQYEAQLAAVMDVDPSAAAAGAAAGSAQQGGGSTLDAKLVLYDKAVNALQEAKAHARSAQKALPGGESDPQFAELTALELAISGTVLQRTIDRSIAMVHDARERYAAGVQRLALGKKLKDKSLYAKPEDVVRLLESLARHYEDLGDLGARQGGRQGEALHEEASDAIDVVRALRCYYVAHSYLTAGKYLEAYALFGRASERATAAAAKAKAAAASTSAGDSSQQQQATVASQSDLQAVAASAKTYRAIAQAEAIAEDLRAVEQVQAGVGAVALTDAQQQQQARYLMDNLDKWESFAGQAGGKGARLYQAPYPLQSVPARPIMLDTASSHVAYPSVDHRIRKATEKKSMLSSLFSWRR